MENMTRSSQLLKKLKIDFEKMKNINKIKKNMPKIRSYRKNKKNKMYSMTNLMRLEVKKILEELSIPLSYLSQDEMDRLIEKCLKERVLFVNEDGNELPLTDYDLKNSYILVKNIAIEMINNNDKDRIIVEYFQILDKRIRSLEKLLTHLHKRLIKTRKEFVGYRINKDAIRSDIMEMLSNSSNPDEAMNILAKYQQISKTRFFKIVGNNDEIKEDVEYKNNYLRSKEALKKSKKQTSRGEITTDMAKFLLNQQNHSKNLKLLTKEDQLICDKANLMKERTESKMQTLLITKITQPPTFVFVEK